MRSKRMTAAVMAAITLLTAACSSKTTSDQATAVKILMIGYNDKDTIDAATGAKIPGTEQLKKAFSAANPDIDLQIINIPWGSGATGYAPKTESMIKAGEACIYEMPAALTYGRHGDLVNLKTLMDKDADFKNVWGKQLDVAYSWGPDDPKSLFYLPNNTGIRVINYDAKLFKDFGVEPLSTQPTLQEIEEKAKKLTGKNPVTGEQNYGYWYQGKYAVWQFMAISHALGANWGGVAADGKMTIKWDTPEYLAALEWFVKMSKYAPEGALGSDAMPQGFLTDKNVVAIIPEGEQGYFIQPLIQQPALRDRFRTVHNLVGSDGLGGLSTISPMVMATKCPNKDAAWKVLKWFAGSLDSQQFYFNAAGRLPVTNEAEKAAPTIAQLPDAQVILSQPQQAEAYYPWAADQPRWAMQTALEAALAGTTTPKKALEQAQKETDDWLAKQGAGQ